MLSKPDILGCTIGESLALDEKNPDLQKYAKDIGIRACSQGYKMNHWSRMFALLHTADGSIIGRASFDDPNAKETNVDLLLVSSNPGVQNPHTFEQTESINVLLLRKEKDVEYVRLGVGEIFTRTGEQSTTLPDRRVLECLVLI